MKLSGQPLGCLFCGSEYLKVWCPWLQAFSVNGGLTIRTLDSGYQNVIGNRDGLSFRDIKLANLMYRCNGESETSSALSLALHRLHLVVVVVVFLVLLVLVHLFLLLHLYSAYSTAVGAFQ